MNVTTTTTTTTTATGYRELSGITPSGELTLGNYLGAMRRFAGRHDGGFYFVADLHALTTDHDPKTLRELTHRTAALMLACGLDPLRATVFVQSDVSEHVELSYLLESTAHVGELNRMIQFKEKGGRPGTRASLFTYPCLMAADILLYDTDQVPVGADQSQHVELTRDLAERFNGRYGETFVVPELLSVEVTARVRNLAAPERKMSKSDNGPGVIRLLDDADQVRRTVRRAATDSDGALVHDPAAKPGLANLAEITSALTGRTPEQVLADCRGYADLKHACAEAVIAELAVLQANYTRIMDDPGQLEQTLAMGARRARSIARATLDRARTAIGLGPCPAAAR